MSSKRKHRCLWGRGAKKNRKPTITTVSGGSERHDVNVHGHVRLLAGEASLASLFLVLPRCFGTSVWYVRGVLAQVQLPQLALPPRRQTKDKTKENMNPAFSHHESAPDVCKERFEETNFTFEMGFANTLLCTLFAALHSLHHFLGSDEQALFCMLGMTGGR